MRARGCQGCVTCAKWPLIMRPLSSALWVDIHQAVKLLMQKIPVLVILGEEFKD